MRSWLAMIAVLGGCQSILGIGETTQAVAADAAPVVVVDAAPVVVADAPLAVIADAPRLVADGGPDGAIFADDAAPVSADATAGARDAAPVVPDAGVLFTLDPASAARVVRGGDAVEVDVTVERKPGFHGDVQVNALNLPPNVTAQGGTAVNPSTTAALVLHATSGADLGLVAGVSLMANYNGNVASEPLSLLVQDAAGTLDITFGDQGIANGFVAGYLPTLVTSVVIDKHGRILIGGEANGAWAMLRLLADGSIDTSFGDHGGLAGPVGELQALALDGGGNIVAGGTVAPMITVMRWDDTGTPDISFGDGGMAQIPAELAKNGYDEGMALDPVSGDLYVAGGSDAGGMLCSFDANGGLRTGFGAGGCIAIGAGQLDAVAVGADGAIATGGYDGASSAIVAITDSDGSAPVVLSALDFMLDDTGESAALALAPQSPHAFFVGGYVDRADPSYRDTFVVRVVDSAVDASFVEGDVVAAPPLYGVYTTLTALAVQPDQSIVTVGWGMQPSAPKQGGGVTRLGPDGLIDGDFGLGGTTQFRTSPTQLNAIALQDDGRIVVVGLMPGLAFAAARLWP